jgi:hypothetical protein
VSAAPDYCEPVIGWRVWYGVESSHGTHLSSIYHESLWPHGHALRAWCGRAHLPFPFRRTPHDSPAERCRCGIHAGIADAVRQYLPACMDQEPAAHPVIGRVALWGDVVECERGWRASRAYPERLYVPSFDGGPAAPRLARGLEAYGVPVEVVDRGTPMEPEVATIIGAAGDPPYGALDAFGAIAPHTWRLWGR